MNGVTVKSDDVGSAETSAVQSSIDKVELLKIMGPTIESMVQGKALMMEASQTALLDAFKAEISAYAKPKSQILHVEIEGIKRKLTKRASPLLADLLVNAQLGLNSLIVGPAGSGKTTVAHQVAEALGRTFGHLNCTSGASESWLFGRQTATGFIESEFCLIYERGGVFLLDEFDAADANFLLCINTAIANGHLYNPIMGKSIKKNPEFVLIAAANTFGKGGNAVYTGRSRLDGATLNRFAGTVLVLDYDKELEGELCPDTALSGRLWDVRAKLKEIGSSEIVSTRHFENAYALKNAGISYADILERISNGWPAELVTQTGLCANLQKASTKMPEEAKAEVVKGDSEPKRIDRMEHQGKRYGSGTPCKKCSMKFKEHNFIEKDGNVTAHCPNDNGTEFEDGSAYSGK